MIGKRNMKIRLPYLTVIRDRKDRPRYYVRKRGSKAIMIRRKPGTPEFLEAYRVAVETITEHQAPSKPLPKTWRWLCEAYMASSEYGGLSRATKRQRELVLQATWREPHTVGIASPVFGDCPLSHFGPKQVRVLRDRKQEHPAAANHRIKCIRTVFDWAIEAEHVSGINPGRDVRNLKSRNPEGHHTWTVAEVEQYRQRHPVGTKPRLALELLLFTGVRRSDVVMLGRPKMQDGLLSYVPMKTRDAITIPILPQLQAVIDATPLTGVSTWLVTQYGRPFTSAGFGNWFRDQCDAAGLHHCSAHGLRKAGATIAAENGATPHELQAIYGWATLKQVELYTRKANRKHLAGGAMKLLVARND